MRVIDHVQNSVPRASREIRDLELEELNGILTQEPPAAQQDESRIHTDARTVELGDPSTNAALPTPPRPEFQSPMQQHPISGPVCTAATRKRFVVAMCCCPLGSILCIHAAKDTSVVTRSSCFSARKGRIQRSNARKNAEHAVLDEAVERATNEWSASQTCESPHLCMRCAPLSCMDALCISLQEPANSLAEGAEPTAQANEVRHRYCGPHAA